MDIMTLAAKLVLDDSGFKSGVSAAESAGEKLAGKMSAMTVAVGNIAADMIKTGFNAVKNMIGGAVDAYADYQQLVGGVETLFKGSAGRVQQYAKESFKATGLSSNEYMETVTSFSASLLQGLKGDTDAAAELANTAIQDMADNANKMGTDISSIQTAYQGFAKQNYTMLDNLKLGYGGTAGEMVRLVNDSKILDHEIENLDEITFDQLIQAIHEIQKEMGITGTTAKEAADTISGSKASLAAAWKDLMSAVGGEEGEDGNQARLDETLENFKTSFQTYMDNYIPTLQTTIENLGTLVNGVADAVSNLPQSMISNLFYSGLTASTDMIKGVGTITTWLIGSITQTFRDAKFKEKEIEDFGAAIGEFLGSAVSQILTSAPDIITGAFTIGVNLATGIIEGIFSGLLGGDDEVFNLLNSANEEMANSIYEANKQSTKAQGILEYMQSLIDKYGDAAKETKEWKKAEDELESILEGSKDVFEKYGGNVQGAVDKLTEMNKQLKEAAVEQAKQKALGTKLEAYTTAQGNLWEAQTQADLQRQIANEARTNLINLIQRTDKTFTGQNVSNQQLEYIAYSAASELGESETQVKAWVDQLNESESSAKKLEDSFNELQAKVDYTKTQYDEAASAVEKFISSAGKSSTTLATLFENLKINLPTTTTTAGNGVFSDIFSSLFGGTSTPTPRAVGLDYATDGMLAQLHQGEAILTKEENERRRSGSMDFEAMESALEDAIERSMGRMRIDMNGERVASLTSGQIGRNNRRNTNARVRAMGG